MDLDDFFADSARESRTLRRRGEADAIEATRLDDARSPLPGPMLVKTITQTSYPTSAAKVFAVQEVGVDATETEGATPTFTDVAGTFYAVNIGGAVPPVGTKLIAEPIDGRWTISYG